jgi:hypothetical protein
MKPRPHEEGPHDERRFALIVQEKRQALAKAKQDPSPSSGLLSLALVRTQESHSNNEAD